MKLFKILGNLNRNSPKLIKSTLVSIKQVL